MSVRALARRPSVWVFAILWASAAFFWHARDWNTASRLMLTYALGDRGTIRLDGLERQTGDIARFQDHYYTDKSPGFSVLAVPPYLAARALFRLPPHPLDRDGLPYWEADYPVTLCISGLATALLGAWLAEFARALGCGPGRSALVGLSYGLATPAYVYATLAYGHQVSALALFGAFVLVVRQPSRRPWWDASAAGCLAALAAVTEPQVAVVSALLGIGLLVAIARRQRPVTDALVFALGAAGPLLALIAYNVAAFGNPWDMGYFHHATARFAEVHSAANPLGLRAPDWSRALPLLLGSYRGLLYYAPILLLAVPGWVVLCGRRDWSVALLSLGACALIFLVNLSYPEWTGGWCTGPRLLVPLLPLAMVPVAALLSTRHGTVLALALLLTGAGAFLMLLFQGVGGRCPESLFGQPLTDPLRAVVVPLWRGDAVPRWWIGERFTRTVVSWIWPGPVRDLGGSFQWLQFLPLVAFQALAITVMLRVIRRPTG